jgi:hypothetical protein
MIEPRQQTTPASKRMLSVAVGESRDARRRQRTATLLVGLLYSLTLIHFFVAVYYSVNARQSYGLALPNVDELVENIQTDKVEAIDRTLNDITRTKYNEPILLQKSNFLAVAETMFRRGLLFIATASILVVITKLLVETNLLQFLLN